MKFPSRILFETCLENIQRRPFGLIMIQIGPLQRRLICYCICNMEYSACLKILRSVKQSLQSPIRMISAPVIACASSNRKYRHSF